MTQFFHRRKYLIRRLLKFGKIQPTEWAIRIIWSIGSMRFQWRMMFCSIRRIYFWWITLIWRTIRCHTLSLSLSNLWRFPHPQSFKIITVPTYQPNVMEDILHINNSPILQSPETHLQENLWPQTTPYASPMLHAKVPIPKSGHSTRKCTWKEILARMHR